MVGDRVRWQASGDEGVIEQVEPRRNLLYRQDEWKTKSFAANLDQLLVLVAAEPAFSESQLARALIAAESAGIAGAHRAEQDRPAARRRGAPSASRPTAAMGVDVLELALKARPDERARASSRRCWPDARRSVLGPSGTRQEHADQPAGARRRGAGRRDLAARSTPAATRRRRRSGTGSTRRAATALIDSPGFQEFGLRQIERRRCRA